MHNGVASSLMGSTLDIRSDRLLLLFDKPYQLNKTRYVNLEMNK